MFGNSKEAAGGGGGAVQFMSTSSSGEKNLNEPYKYFGSQAEKIRAFQEKTASDEYKSYIVSASLAVFMIYFCILREPNDVDEKLGLDLYDHWGPEVSRLKKAYDYNIKNNLPTGEITERMRALGAPVPPGA